MKTPNLYVILTVIGGFLITGFLIYNQLQYQKEQIALLTNTVVELKVQNEMIIAANQAIDKDMKAIKEGMETYNQNIVDINKNTKSLSRYLSSNEFRNLLSEGVEKAMPKFNEMFNLFFKETHDAITNR